MEHLSTYNLEDVFPKLVYDEMRSQLSDKYGTPVNEIRVKKVYFQGKCGYYVLGEQDDQKILTELKDFRRKDFG